MREFSHGWRRKAGCVMLVMALAVAGAWVRGFSMNDSFSIRSDEWHDLISFSREGVKWVRYDTPNDVASKHGRFSNGWRSLPATEDIDFGECRWRWRLLGFDFGECRNKALGVYRRKFWRIPYWPLVTSLALLSAYLILWKPRPKTKGEPNA